MLRFAPDIHKAIEFNSQVIKVPEKTYICYAGDSAEFIYVVRNGVLEIKLSSGRLNEEVTADYVGPGDSFFLLDGINEERYIASLYAPQACEVLKIPRLQAVEILNKYPATLKGLKFLASHPGLKKMLSEKTFKTIASDKLKKLPIEDLATMQIETKDFSMGQKVSLSKGIYVIDTGSLLLTTEKTETNYQKLLFPGDYIVCESENQGYEIDIPQKCQVVHFSDLNAPIFESFISEWKRKYITTKGTTKNSNSVTTLPPKQLSLLRSWFPESRLDEIRMADSDDDKQAIQMLNCLLLLGTETRLDDARRFVEHLSDQGVNLSSVASIFELNGHNTSFKTGRMNIPKGGLSLTVEENSINIFISKDRSHIFSLDPKKGIIDLPKGSIKQANLSKWLEVEPAIGIKELLEPSNEPKANDLAIKKFLYRNLFSYKKYFLNLLGLAVVLGLIGSAKGIVFQNVISQLSLTREIELILGFGYALLTLAFFYFGLNLVYSLLSTYLKSEVAIKVKLLNLKNSFFSVNSERCFRNPTQYIQWLNSFDSLTSQLVEHPLAILKSSVAIVFLLIFLGLLSIKYALIYLVFIVISGLFVLRFINKSNSFFSKVTQKKPNSSGLKFEDFYFIAFNIGSRKSMSNFQNKAEVDLFNSVDQVSRYEDSQAKLNQLIKFLNLGFFSLIYYFSITESFNSPTAAATISGVLIYLGIISGEVQQLFSSMIAYANWEENFARLRTLFSPNEIYHRLKSRSLFIKLNGKIRLEGISYRYPENSAPSLAQVSLSIAPGDFILVVGKSGSGKSTFVKMISQELQPNIGKISFDEIDTKHLSPSLIRSQVSFVGRKPDFIPGSIKDNIILDKKADLNLLNKACRISMLNSFSGSLQALLDSKVEFGTTTLSAGQAQLVGLARAIYQNCPILILDEATSYVDARTSAEIIGNIIRDPVKRTVILTTHQLSLAKFADRILVFKDGMIVEAGSHDQLLRSGKEYAELYRSQGGID